MVEAEAAASLARTTVALDGPLDLARSLEMFRRSGDDGLDRWDGERLLRTLRHAGRTIPFACWPCGSVAAPGVELATSCAGDLPAVAAAVRTMFIGDPAALAALAAADPLIAALDRQYLGVRTVRQYDLLAALVRSISAQQVNLRWAATTRRRLAETFGVRHAVGDDVVWSLEAPALASLRVADIRALQFTTRKAEYIIAAADAVAAGRVDLASLQALPDEAVIARLTALRGIGAWTAEWLLARTLGRPRVVAGDLGVRKAVGLAYADEPLPSEAAVRRLTAHWGAAAGMAQTLLLYAMAEGTLGR